LVPQPYGSPELSPTSVFLFSERMFTWLSSKYTRKSARTSNTYVFKIMYGMLGKTEMSPGIVLMQAEVIMFNNICVVCMVYYLFSPKNFLTIPHTLPLPDWKKSC
jgi:hypothetical protein